MFIVYPCLLFRILFILLASFTWVALAALFGKNLVNIAALSRRAKINIVYLVIFRNFLINLQRVCSCASLRLCPWASLRQSDSSSSANGRPIGYLCSKLYYLGALMRNWMLVPSYNIVSFPSSPPGFCPSALHHTCTSGLHARADTITPPLPNSLFFTPHAWNIH